MIWKKIKNSREYYVSENGDIKRGAHEKWCKLNNSISKYKEKILKPNNNNSKKYFRISIMFNNNEYKTCSVHRLVAESFIPCKNYNNLQVNHIDGNKSNNHVSNLEWCTGVENMRHRREILGIKQGINGENCNFAKLSEKEVLSIPNLLENGYKKSEIDLIVKIDNTIAFVEIKTRSNTIFDMPENAVNTKKIEKLQEGALYYIESNEIKEDVRFDILTIIKYADKIEINHIIDAFWG